MRTLRMASKALPVMIACFACSSARAQAWVPEEGQASVSMYYERGEVSRHLFSGDLIDVDGTNYGKKIDAGHITTNTMYLNIEYGLSNQLAVSASIPAVSSKYEGIDVENPVTDNGQYHGGFQDFRLEARYMAVDNPLVVTPFLSLVLPSHDYPTFGHVAVGRRLKELHAGVYLGKLLTFVSDDLVVDAGYDFGFVEKVSGVRPNRSRFDFGLGYFLTPSVTLGGNASYLITHNGMDWLDEMDETAFNDHDRMAKARLLQLAATVSFDVSDALRIFVGYSAIVWGENTHNLQSLGTGLNWTLYTY